MNNRVQLQRSLASIATQDFTDFEVIVAEGSTSPISAVEIEESWPSLQNKVMVKNGGTSGIYEAMNIGVSFSSAPWIFFLGDDDFLWSTTVLSTVAANLTPGLQFIYGNVFVLSHTPWAKGGTRYGGEFSNDRIMNANISQQAIFYSKRLIQKHGGFDTRFKVCADWDFNLRVFAESKKKYIDIIVSGFSGTGVSTRVTDDVFLTLYPMIVRDAFGLKVNDGYFRRHTDKVQRLIQYLADRNQTQEVNWFSAALESTGRRAK